jgi:hypothetical protein
LNSQVSLREKYCDIDSKAYLEKGELFYRTHSFFKLNSPAPYYGLGYPFFISGVYFLSGQSKDNIIFAQVIISLLSFLLLFFLVKRLFGVLTSVITLILCAFNLGYLVFSQFILTEVLLSFFLILFFERLTYFLCAESQNPPGNNSELWPELLINLIISGFSLGLSIIIKPAALYFPFLLIPVFLWRVKEYNSSGLLAGASPGGHSGLGKKIKILSVFLLSFYTPVIIYMTHNFYTFGEFKLGSLGTVNVYYWFYPNVLAQSRGTTSDIERDILQKRDINNVRAQFIKDLKEKPFIFIFVWLKNVCKTLVGLYTTNLKVLVEDKVKGGDISFFKIQGGFFKKFYNYISAGVTKNWVFWVGVLEALFIIIRLFFVLISLLYLFLNKKYLLFYLFISYIVYFLFITGHDGCARFRMLCEWNLLVLTAVGISIILRETSNEQCVLSNSCGGKWGETMAIKQ